MRWALEITQSPDKHSMHNSLRGAWSLVEGMFYTLAKQLRPDPDAHMDPASSSVVQRAVQTITSFSLLPVSRQRKQLSSHSFWAVEVQEWVLPATRHLAAAVLAVAPALGTQETPLRVAAALATRVCANPGCLELRGCSEGRLRSRRCSGCGVARYCCRTCQAADWEAHGRVCKQLREHSNPM